MSKPLLTYTGQVKSVDTTKKGDKSVLKMENGSQYGDAFYLKGLGVPPFVVPGATITFQYEDGQYKNAVDQTITAAVVGQPVAPAPAQPANVAAAPQPVAQQASMPMDKEELRQKRIMRQSSLNQATAILGVAADMQLINEVGSLEALVDKSIGMAKYLERFNSLQEVPKAVREVPQTGIQAPANLAPAPQPVAPVAPVVTAPNPAAEFDDSIGW